jgi:hypothetical protein
MTKATLCDRCDIRIDKNWNGIPLTVKNTTSTGGPSTIHLCLDCHTEIRDTLYPLLLGENGPYEHPEVMNE